MIETMNLWPFRKRVSLQDSGIFSGFTDWHSHILPGVDDGVRTMGESLEILRLYEELGVRSVWLTPHIMEDIPNTTAHLRERFAELQASYSGSVELHLAAENMLDGLFEERLEKNDLLPLGENGDHLFQSADGLVRHIGTDQGQRLPSGSRTPRTIWLYGERRLPTDKRHGREVATQSLLNSRRIWKTDPRKSRTTSEIRGV